MTAAVCTIDEAIQRRDLLGASIGDLESWRTWRIVVRAAYGHGSTFTSDELAIYHAVSGGRDVPPARVQQLWVVAGRRGGKSRVAAAIATYEATLVDHASKLSPGETGYILSLSASRVQASTIKNYAEGFLKEAPDLRAEILEVTSEEIRLTGNVTISVHTNNHRTVRGLTLLACIFDEVAFWRDDNSTNPAKEVLRAIEPALGTTGGMLVGISSSYRKTGLLYDRYTEYFGKDDPDILVISADTRTLNPTFDPKVIDRAMASDELAARNEYGAEFRDDISSFIGLHALERVVDSNVLERAPSRERLYKAFTDPAGGSGGDSMTLAIAHTEGTTRVLDLVREVKPPFSPQADVEEFCGVLRKYRISTVHGDRYAGDWPAEQFRNRGVNYEISERVKRQIYTDFLPLVNSGSVALLAVPEIRKQLLALERKPTSAGWDSIDHPAGGHDDVANVVAGALTLVPESFILPDWARSAMPGGIDAGHSYAVPESDPFA